MKNNNIEILLELKDILKNYSTMIEDYYITLNELEPISNKIEELTKTKYKHERENRKISKTKNRQLLNFVFITIILIIVVSGNFTGLGNVMASLSFCFVTSGIINYAAYLIKTRGSMLFIKNNNIDLINSDLIKNRQIEKNMLSTLTIKRLAIHNHNRLFKNKQNEIDYSIIKDDKETIEYINEQKMNQDTKYIYVLRKK